MIWSPSELDYGLPFGELIRLGKDTIDQGATELNLRAWNEATSAHLAIILTWHNYACERTDGVKITGFNKTFLTLAKLGGVEFLTTGTEDVGQ